MYNNYGTKHNIHEGIVIQRIKLELSGNKDSSRIILGCCQQAQYLFDRRGNL